MGRVAGLSGPPRLRHGLRGPRHGAGRPDELPLSGQSSSSAGGRPRHRRLRETGNKAGSATEPRPPVLWAGEEEGQAGPPLHPPPPLSLPFPPYSSSSIFLFPPPLLPPCPLGPGGARSHKLGQQMPHRPRQGAVSTPRPRPPLSRRRTHHVGTAPATSDGCQAPRPTQPCPWNPNSVGTAPTTSDGPQTSLARPTSGAQFSKSNRSSWKAGGARPERPAGGRGGHRPRGQAHISDPRPGRACWPPGDLGGG